MRRGALVALLAAVAGLATLTASAAAHPLGNFSINHLTRIAVGQDGVQLRYILDQAEIPTFQERGLADDRVLGLKHAEVARHLTLSVNGRPVPLRFPPGASISHPPGQGGLPLTRVELPLTATVTAPRSVVLRDETFAGRVGWKAIVPQPGTGTSVRTTAASGDPTHGLRSYPKDQLRSPLDERSATFTVRPGDGTLTAPANPGAGKATTTNRSGDGLAGVFGRASQGEGVLLFLLLAAFGWGALHALSPGHGKAMVAAYLVGTRGTARHATALGIIVTVTHTIGVFALGLVTLLLSQYILPEQLYPWLTLASGLLILVIGGSVLRSRIRATRAGAAAAEHGHWHAHDHEHSHQPGHDHGHSHEHTHSHGGRSHSHAPPERITWRGLVGMGASAGLIPCPSALVVLLGAVAQHQLALGLILIVAFSFGLAATLTALGLAVIWAGGLTSRVNVRGPIATALPTVSAVIIVAAGMVVTARALPGVL